MNLNIETGPERRTGTIRMDLVMPKAVRDAREFGIFDRNPALEGGQCLGKRAVIDGLINLKN